MNKTTLNIVFILKNISAVYSKKPKVKEAIMRNSKKHWCKVSERWLWEDVKYKRDVSSTQHVVERLTKEMKTNKNVAAPKAKAKAKAKAIADPEREDPLSNNQVKKLEKAKVGVEKLSAQLDAAIEGLRQKDTEEKIPQWAYNNWQRVLARAKENEATMELMLQNGKGSKINMIECLEVPKIIQDAIKAIKVMRQGAIGDEEKAEEDE